MPKIGKLARNLHNGKTDRATIIKKHGKDVWKEVKAKRESIFPGPETSNDRNSKPMLDLAPIKPYDPSSRAGRQTNIPRRDYQDIPPINTGGLGIATDLLVDAHREEIMQKINQMKEFPDIDSPDNKDGLTLKEIVQEWDA